MRKKERVLVLNYCKRRIDMKTLHLFILLSTMFLTCLFLIISTFFVWKNVSFNWTLIN